MKRNLTEIEQNNLKALEDTGQFVQIIEHEGYNGSTVYYAIMCNQDLILLSDEKAIDKIKKRENQAQL